MIVTPLPDGASRGVPVPWWAKIALKMILARMPVPYSLWHKLGLFRHGSAALQLSTATSRLAAALDTNARLGGGDVTRVLELGPGDSLAVAVAAKARGVESVFVDVGDFAAYDSKAYSALARQSDNPQAFKHVDFSSRETMLKTCGSAYATQGLSSLKCLPSETIDVTLSNVVLEHVRAREFDEFLAELFRVTREGGTGRHIVDVMDHLGGGLNNLRLSSRFWEADLFANSGFYTNRLRPREILAKARKAGFIADIVSVQTFPAGVFSRNRIASEFQNLPDSDFEIATFEMVLSKPAAGYDHGAQSD